MHSLLERFLKQYGRLPTEVDPDYLEMLRMTKYRLLNVPDASPGKCCNCGASRSDGRGYLDVGLHVEWYGAVYFCGHCLRELATAMGLFTALETEVKELKSRLNEFEDLQQKGVELHETVVKTHKELADYYASLHTPGISSTGDSSSSSNSNLGDESSTIKPGTAGAEQGTSKPSNVSGRKDVPSLTDLISNSS